MNISSCTIVPMIIVITLLFVTLYLISQNPVVSPTSGFNNSNMEEGFGAISSPQWYYDYNPSMRRWHHHGHRSFPYSPYYQY